MTDRTITLTHNGVEYSGEIMTIKSTSFGYEDHGILSVMLHCERPGSGVGVGGYGLDEWKEDQKKRVPTAYGLDFIVQVMRTVGVESWEKLPGKSVVVLYEGNSRSHVGQMSKGIANLLTDEVFILEEHAKTWKEESAS